MSVTEASGRCCAGKPHSPDLKGHSSDRCLASLLECLPPMLEGLRPTLNKNEVRCGPGGLRQQCKDLKLDSLDTRGTQTDQIYMHLP